MLCVLAWVYFKIYLLCCLLLLCSSMLPWSPPVKKRPVFFALPHAPFLCLCASLSTARFWKNIPHNSQNKTHHRHTPASSKLCCSGSGARTGGGRRIRKNQYTAVSCIKYIAIAIDAMVGDDGDDEGGDGTLLLFLLPLLMRIPMPMPMPMLMLMLMLFAFVLVILF